MTEPPRDRSKGTSSVDDQALTAVGLGADDLYRALVETSSELICLIDPEGLVAFASRASRDILGYSPEEMRGKHFSEFLDVEEAFQAEGMFRQTRVGQVQLQREISALHKNGHTVDLIFNARPLFGEDGNFRGAVSVVSDISELKRLHENLERLANEDDLTGLANRRRFIEHIGAHMAHADRYGWRGALLIVDLDRLKAVNDRYGHAAGDELIVQVAERLAGRVRRSDLVSRLWGDEFAVLLPEADREDASEVAAALCAAIGDAPFRVDTDTDVSATASIGVAMMSEPVELDELMSRADAALYRAKERGGGGAEIHPGSAGSG